MKRIFASALAVIMALCLALSALGASGAALFGKVSGRSSLNLAEFSTLLDVTYQTAGGGTAQYFHSYAFADEGRDAVRWREIRPRDLTVEFLWDISGLIRRPGKLVLSSAPVRGNTAQTLADCENSDESGGITYAIYTISAIAPNPSRIGRDSITYDGDGGAFIDIGAGSEWSRDGFIWRPADNNGPYGANGTERWCHVPLSSARQTIHVRGMGDASDSGSITIPSRRPVRVTVPAIPRAPRVNIYPGQGFLSARAGMEISNDGKRWAAKTENTLPLGTVTDLPAAAGDGSVQIDLNDGQDVYIRNPAGGGRPPSEAFETRIRIVDAGEVSEEHFISAPGKTLRIDASVVIEAFTDGRWRRVRRIDADSIPDDGLRVRRAGTRDRMPGPEGVLRLTSQGGLRTVSVSN
jgi:hypothetical protein